MNAHCSSGNYDNDCDESFHTFCATLSCYLPSALALASLGMPSRMALNNRSEEKARRPRNRRGGRNETPKFEVLLTTGYLEKNCQMCQSGLRVRVYNE